MTTRLAINGDTYISQVTPGQVNGGSAYLAVCAGTGIHRYSLLHVAVPNLVGSIVTSALLHVTLRGTDWRIGNKIRVDLLVNPFTEQSTWNGYTSKLPALPTAHQVVHTNVHENAGAHEVVDVTQLLVDASQTSAFYGLLLSTDSVTAGRQLFSSETSIVINRPFVDIAYSQAPPSPIDLAPAAAAGVARPRLTWKSANQTAFEVQISATQNGSLPDFDTGRVTSADTGYDTAEASTWTPPAAGNSTSWRVRVLNSVGATSAWSPWAEYLYQPYGTLAITDPAFNGALVDATTPEVIWSLSGATQVAFEVLSGSYDSGRTTGADTETQLPAGLVAAPGVSYGVEVRAWDSIVRDAPGELGYVSATRTFIYDNTGSATAPVDTLTAVQDGPAVILRWTRTSEPDSFLVVANGGVVEAVDPGRAALGDGQTYVVRFLAAQPQLVTTWEVRAHDDSTGDSTGNPTATATLNPVGIWLAYGPLDIEVQLLGQDSIDMKITEDGATFLPLGRRAPVRIVDQVRGYEGTLSGILAGEDDLDKFNGIKAVAPNTTDVRLIYGTYNFPVQLGEVSVSEAPIAGGEPLYQVTAEFWQVGPPWPDDPVALGWGAFAWGDSQWR